MPIPSNFSPSGGVPLNTEVDRYGAAVPQSGTPQADQDLKSEDVAKGTGIQPKSKFSSKITDLTTKARAKLRTTTDDLTRLKKGYQKIHHHVLNSLKLSRGESNAMPKEAKRKKGAEISSPTLQTGSKKGMEAMAEAAAKTSIKDSHETNPFLQKWNKLDPQVQKEVFNELTEALLNDAGKEGILRLSGSEEKKNTWFEALFSGTPREKLANDSATAGVAFKQIYRNLSLFNDQKAEFLKVGDLALSDQERLAKMKDIISNLSPANRAHLARLLDVLGKIEERKETNKMNSSNLAVVIGPNLADNTGVELLQNTAAQGRATQFMIDKRGDLGLDSIQEEAKTRPVPPDQAAKPKRNIEQPQNMPSPPPVDRSKKPPRNSI